ncbi:hypothetical protein EOD42_14185 [Rhodovarius crocodyli]|uniref:Uncharacterized protein n=1 Tax=Rhodovarius crocodyli TaxID=1979269 RepID=A0A437MF41_9PROT|nr:hypothetical protein [Rhodovarius crocodyli]RVT96257.1 hypothetical protein EOD42_14185 [Rhodovarius crocodyli]
MSEESGLEMLGPPSPDALAAYHVIHDSGVILSLGCSAAHLVPLYISGTPYELLLIDHATFNAVRGRLEAFHVAGGAVLQRVAAPIALSASSIAADGEAQAVISGIPDGAEISVRGAASVPWTPVIGTAVTLTSTEPGQMLVTVRLPPPYLEWRDVIHAV